MRYHRFGVAPMVLLMFACRASRPSIPPAPPSRGSLDLVVRPADRPTQGLADAQVLLRSQSDTFALAADDHGAVSFLDLPLGAYDILVRRVGYDPTHTTIRIQANCPTKGEVFLAPTVYGIGERPQRSGRVAIIGC